VRVAGPVPRALAWMIDTLIRLIGYFILGLLFTWLAPDGLVDALLALTIFASEWLYFSLFEGLSGATPGKRRCGLMVVQKDGAPCGLEASFVRNIVRFVDFLPPVYGFGLMSMFFSADFQRLGDRAAGTLVVYGDAEVEEASPGKSKERGRRRRERVDSTGAVAPKTEPVPVPVALTGEEEAAVLEFARRAPVWGDERANEIASLAESLTRLTGNASRLRLLQYAKWLGERGA